MEIPAFAGMTNPAFAEMTTSVNSVCVVMLVNGVLMFTVVSDRDSCLLRNDEPCLLRNDGT